MSITMSANKNYSQNWGSNTIKLYCDSLDFFEIIISLIESLSQVSAIVMVP